MKKLLIVMLLLAVAAPALAGQGASNTGCGLGTVLWGNESDGSVISQSLQATTNGTFGNQTFGITSGTLGCDQPANLVKNDRLLAFTADNLDLLARDIASGQGETLATVAELLDVPSADQPAFNTALQANFDKIFVTGTETAGVVLDRIAVIAL
ncbi:MAG: DUF3015 domain-containing protein [Desulfuromonadales bacterium]|nr:DUF3015 domain-containing protein [Desulfuromonadales bacterium]